MTRKSLLYNDFSMFKPDKFFGQFDENKQSMIPLCKEITLGTLAVESSTGHSMITLELCSCAHMGPI